MSRQRITAALLSLLLLGLLVWSMLRGVGGPRTQIFLGIGTILGAIDTIHGRLPHWIIARSGGSLVADDDPDNLPLRVYLPFLLAVIVIGIVALVVVIYFF